MNRIIRLLMLSDIFFSAGLGLVQPILAIFVADRVAGGSIRAAGIAMALYLISKSMVQLPFSRYVDRHDDKVKWLLVGNTLVTIVPLLYIVAKDVWMVYAAQIIFGIGAGLAFPTWLGLWSAYLDKHHESFEWSMYSTLTSIAAAITAAVGAIMVETIGFEKTFIAVAALSAIGTVLLVALLPKQEKNVKVPSTHFHKKRNASNHR